MMLAATRANLYMPASAAFPYITSVSNSTRNQSNGKAVVPKQELVGNNPPDRNWKGMFIAILVILAVCGFIILAIVLLSPEDNIPYTSTVSLSNVLGEEWKDGLAEDAIWRGKNLIYQDSFGNIVAKISPYIQATLLISNRTMSDYDIMKYTVSHDLKYALLGYRGREISLMSNISYIIYKISDGSKTKIDSPDTEGMIQDVDFGPKGNQLAFVLEGDIYYRDSVNGQNTRLTRLDGTHGTSNGVADWMYKNKILETSRAFWWAPDGTNLAYASFDDRGVFDMTVTSYTNTMTSESLLYPSTKVYKQSKAGLALPVVTVSVVNLVTKKQVLFRRPTVNRKTLDIFQSLSWMSDDELLITWSNRTLTYSSTQKCFKNISTCVDDVTTQFAPRKKAGEISGWLRNLNQGHVQSDKNGVYFYILPSPHGGKGSFNHVTMINTNEKPTKITYLTSGNWEVWEIFHFDSSSRSLFYSSNELHPSSKHVFSINIDDTNQKTCITCILQTNAAFDTIQVVSIASTGDRKLLKYAMYGDKPCLYFSAKFSKKSDWYLLTCLGPALPYPIMFPLNDRNNASGAWKSERIINPPSSLMNVITPLVKYKTLVKNGREIHIKIMTPATLYFGKRPIVFITGNFGEQKVDFKFRLDIGAYIVAKAKLVAVYVDGMGAGGYGNARVDAIRNKPGVLEIEDMKSVLKWMEGKENMDTENVAVLGVGGYAGFTSLLAVTQHQNPFGCAVAISPITNWNSADSFSSEKILGLPFSNPVVYDKSNLLRRTKGLKGSKTQVYHGLQDELVSVQHSLSLEDAVMKSNLPVGTVTFNYYDKLLLTKDDNSFQHRFQKSHMLRSANVFLQNCLLKDYKKNGPMEPDELEPLEEDFDQT